MCDPGISEFVLILQNVWLAIFCFQDTNSHYGGGIKMHGFIWFDVDYQSIGLAHTDVQSNPLLCRQGQEYAALLFVVVSVIIQSI